MLNRFLRRERLRAVVERTLAFETLHERFERRIDVRSGLSEEDGFEDKQGRNENRERMGGHAEGAGYLWETVTSSIISRTISYAKPACSDRPAQPLSTSAGSLYV